jgi:hypothetical protein
MILELPPITQIENREAVIFEAAAPRLTAEITPQR